MCSGYCNRCFDISDIICLISILLVQFTVTLSRPGNIEKFAMVLDFVCNIDQCNIYFFLFKKLWLMIKHNFRLIYCVYIFRVILCFVTTKYNLRKIYKNRSFTNVNLREKPKFVVREMKCEGKLIHLR